MKAQRYYADTNGRIACQDHVGMYAKSALEQKPNLKRIETPITLWMRLTDDEVTEIESWGHGICESCR